MMLRYGNFVFGHLTQGLDEVDDGVAVQVPRTREDSIHGNDDTLRAGEWSYRFV
jgi:hypothetical protein